MESSDPPEHIFGIRTFLVQEGTLLRNSLRKEARTKVQVTACLTPSLANWPMLSTLRTGRKIESATINGTGHHRVQCPIVLSPHPQALQTTSEVGVMSQDRCH